MQHIKLKIYRLFLCGLVGLLLLSACSKQTAESSHPDEPVVLKMAGWGISSTELRLIEDYNASQTEYQVEVIDYWELLDVDNLSDSEVYAAITRMDMDLATRKDIDLFSLSRGININGLAYSGALLDMNSFIDNDPEIDREDYHPTLWELTEIDGKLFELPVSYVLEGIMLPEKFVSDWNSWTIPEYIEIEKQFGEPLLKTDSSKLLQYYVIYGFSDYLNFDEGTCSFDSESFQNMLSFIDHVGKSFEQYKGDFYEPAFLYMISGVSSWPQIVDDWINRYGERPVLVGYPQDTPRSPAGNPLMYSYGISTASANPQGCWEFIKFLLSEHAQSSFQTGGFPVLNSLVEDELLRSMLPGDDPNSLVYGTKKRDGSNEPLSPLEADDVEYLRDIIYGISSTKMLFSDVETIVQEEAQAFFAGDKSVEETCRLIQSRVSLFLSERHQGLPSPVTPEVPESPSPAVPQEPDTQDAANRTPKYPDAGYTIKDGAVWIDDTHFSLSTKTLKLEDATLSDYRFLAELTELEELTLYNTAATIDLTPLEGLPNLQWVFIMAASCENSDLSPLTNCPALTHLTLEFIKTGLDAVADMTQLKTLEIVLSAFDDLSFIENLTNLECLVIAGNKSADIAPLIEYKLPNLKRLYCMVYEGQLEQLKQAYPDCDITGWLRSTE